MQYSLNLPKHANLRSAGLFPGNISLRNGGEPCRDHLKKRIEVGGGYNSSTEGGDHARCSGSQLIANRWGKTQPGHPQAEPHLRTELTGLSRRTAAGSGGGGDLLLGVCSLITVLEAVWRFM